MYAVLCKCTHICACDNCDCIPVHVAMTCIHVHVYYMSHLHRIPPYLSFVFAIEKGHVISVHSPMRKRVVSTIKLHKC